MSTLLAAVVFDTAPTKTKAKGHSVTLGQWTNARGISGLLALSVRPRSLIRWEPHGHSAAWEKFRCSNQETMPGRHSAALYGHSHFNDLKLQEVVWENVGISSKVGDGAIAIKALYLLERMKSNMPTWASHHKVCSSRGTREGRTNALKSLPRQNPQPLLLGHLKPPVKTSQPDYARLLFRHGSLCALLGT